MGACPAAPDDGYRGAGLLLTTRHHWGRGLSHPPSTPPSTHPSYRPPPPPPLKGFGQPYLLPSARVIIYRAPSAPLRTLHHLWGAGGGGVG